MTKKLSLRKLFITSLAASAVILNLAIFSNTNTSINNQAHLEGAFSARSQFNNEKAEEINDEKVLQFNPLNNEINQFMIYEFKNIYRVKA